MHLFDCLTGISGVFPFPFRCSIGRNYFVLMTVASRGGIGRTLAGHDGLCAEEPYHTPSLKRGKGRAWCLLRGRRRWAVSPGRSVSPGLMQPSEAFRSGANVRKKFVSVRKPRTKTTRHESAARKKIATNSESWCTPQGLGGVSWLGLVVGSGLYTLNR